MWFKLAGATFTNNLGTMDSISKSYMMDYSGLTGLSASPGSVSYANDSTPDATITFTVKSGYVFKSGSKVTASGGASKTYTASADIAAGSSFTMALTGISGKVTFVGAAELVSGGNTGGSGGSEPDTPVSPPSGGTTTTALPLAQGYIDKGVVNNELNTRVRSDGLASGPFSVEVNSGYLIRAIYEHTKQDLSDGGTAIVASADAKTSYSGGVTGKYYAFTFCKSNATQSLSPTESIIKSFSGTIVPITTSSSGGGSGSTTNPEAGTDVTYTLVQGAHVQNDKELYVGPNRVTTDVAIKGKFTVTVNDGYAIRAVYEYTKASGDTAGTLVLETNTSATTFTSKNANKYYGVTFTKAGDNANNDIAPTEAIVKSWKYV